MFKFEHLSEGPISAVPGRFTAEFVGNHHMMWVIWP